MAPEEGSLTSATGKHILIVDDDQDAVALLEMIVKKDGFLADTAADGQEALEKIRKSPPDLILLDLKMPKIHGLEMVRLLQAGEAARVPVIVISGMLDRQTQQMLKQEPNVKGYFTKPVNSGVLTMQIHSLLKTRPRLSQQPADW